MPIICAAEPVSQGLPQMPKLDERAIFDAARRIGVPEARSEYLKQACSGNRELLARIEQLLRVHDEDETFLRSPAVPLPLVVEEDTPGAQIGPYKLVEQIGEGGFGVVYVGEQLRPVRRLVALKIVKPGMDTRQVVARFEAERQALAMMEHPNIARVFDGGSTPAGRPFFAMELVKGVPITRYCDEHQLTPRERLQLFSTVCQAVQHAHQKGIIHRDLKPTNVLVAAYDGQPVPKIIDFGVAKALGERLTERTLVTSFGGIIGTLEYMSPEQAEFNARDVDTRADIYSLGVLLYELLTGATPLEHERVKQAAITETLRLIREEDPPKPSTRLTHSSGSVASISAQRRLDPAALTRAVRGELDWIVMKALDKDRDRRYQTANGLARDVERYLNDEPVEACPPSARYRLGKLLRRHRGPAAATCAVLAVLVGGVATSSLGFLSARMAHRRAEQDQRRAEKNFELAEHAVDDYLNKVTEDPELNRPNFSSLRKKLLESAVPFYERLVDQKPGDAAQEAARGRAYGRLGVLRRQRGEAAEALADFEQMRSIFARLSADFPTEPQYHEGLADAHNCLGLLLAGLGKCDAAEAAHRAALALREKLAAEFPAIPKYRDDLARTRNNLGMLLSDRGEHVEAEKTLRDALVIREQLASDFPTKEEYRGLLAETRANLAALLTDLGNRDEAEVAYRAALALREQLAAEFPTVPEYRKNLAATHDRLGVLLAGLGKRDEAEAAYRAALAILEQLAADVPMVPEFRDMLAKCGTDLGTLLARLGRRDEAEAAFRDALAIRARLAADFPTAPYYRDIVASTACLLAFLLADRGDLSGYRECCHTILSYSGKHTGPLRAWVFVRACLLLADGVQDPCDLLPLIQTARSLDEKHLSHQWILFAQGLHDYRCGRFAEAQTACVNSRGRATVPAVAVMAQTVEAMSFYRLGKDDEARQALSAAGRLLDQTASKLDGSDEEGIWYDWLCCRILRREAEGLLELTQNP